METGDSNESPDDLSLGLAAYCRLLSASPLVSTLSWAILRFTFMSTAYDRDGRRRDKLSSNSACLCAPVRGGPAWYERGAGAAGRRQSLVIIIDILSVVICLIRN
jgi:hypothetical protein